MASDVLCIFGSREGIDPRIVIAFVSTLPLDTVVVVGGGPGVDAVAEQAARARGLDVRVFPADWTQYRKSAGPRRNAEMAAYADRAQGFRIPRVLKSNGSDDCEKRFRKLGKPVDVEICAPHATGENRS
jgi:YspA, cpYpsA-related SLOG family